MSQKQKKTAKELADMVARRIAIGGVFVAVNADPTYGWVAAVVTAPAWAANCQAVADRIATDLRSLYDLAD